MSSYLIYVIILIPSSILFILMYIVSFIYVLNIDDWILVWLGLELNMISYVVLIYRKYDMFVLESCFKYFLIQSLGSALLLVVFYLHKVLSYIVVLLLRYKLGAGPFFYWFPSVCSGVGWISCYILITFQKVIPLFLISGFLRTIIWCIIIISLVLGVLGSINQVNIKSLFAYSSIHHLGWLISCIFIDDLFWLYYLLIYSLILIRIVFYLILYDINDINILSKCKNRRWFIIGFISIGGLPPLLGFFLKWAGFLYILSISHIFVIFLLLISVIILYIYLRVVYDVLIMNSISTGYLMQSNNLLIIAKADYLNFLGLLVGVVMGLILII